MGEPAVDLNSLSESFIAATLYAQLQFDRLIAVINCCTSAVLLSGIIRKALISYGCVRTIAGLDRNFNVRFYVAAARIWMSPLGCVQA